MLAQGGASSSSGDDVEIPHGWNKHESVAASSPGPRKRNHKGDQETSVFLLACVLKYYPNAMETFISLLSVRRVTWLQGKSCSSISRTGTMI
ncbi:hypothetical protein MKX03_014368 [Papaver bracteatum]|nr:hypothetical protein MKX03_014368 [Papaver bracteatum]